MKNYGPKLDSILKKADALSKQIEKALIRAEEIKQGKKAHTEKETAAEKDLLTLVSSLGTFQKELIAELAGLHAKQQLPAEKEVDLETLVEPKKPAPMKKNAIDLDFDEDEFDLDDLAEIKKMNKKEDIPMATKKTEKEVDLETLKAPSRFAPMKKNNPAMALDQDAFDLEDLAEVKKKSDKNKKIAVPSPTKTTEKEVDLETLVELKKPAPMKKIEIDLDSFEEELDLEALAEVKRKSDKDKKVGAPPVIRKIEKEVDLETLVEPRKPAPMKKIEIDLDSDDEEFDLETLAETKKKGERFKKDDAPPVIKKAEKPKEAKEEIYLFDL